MTEPEPNAKPKRNKQSLAEQIEQKLVDEINEKTATLKKNGGQELVPEDPKANARLAVVRAGMAEMQAVYTESEAWRKRAEEAELRITELVNLADQAKEGERMRLKDVSDRAITEARASHAMQEVLQGEIDSLRARIAAADVKVQEAQAEVAKYRTFALMVRASLDKLVPKE